MLKNTMGRGFVNEAAADGYKQCVLEQGAKYGLKLDPLDRYTYKVRARPGGFPPGNANVQVNSFDGETWEVAFLGKWKKFKHLGDALEYAATAKPPSRIAAARPKRSGRG